MNKKGFTLIELLVVITIIGVLAGIVLVGYGDTTKKAKDTRVVTSMSALSTQAELAKANSTENKYKDIIDMSVPSPYALKCNEAGVPAAITTICNDIVKNGNGYTLATVESALKYDSTNDAYCMQIKLNAKVGADTDYYCIDSTGAKGQTTSSASCDGTTSYVCAGLR